MSSVIPPRAGLDAPVFAADKPWLAPLAGYGDLVFRTLCREYGASVCEGEMVSAKGLFYGNSGTTRLLKNTAADSPLIIQFFGAEPEIMAHAVLEAREAGYYWLDCNMGCSVRKVMRQGAGAALLESVDGACAVASAMIRAANEPLGDKPAANMGFKLRLGLAPGKLVAHDLALRLEDLGAAWICLHPRYASQGFGGEADWNKIAKLAKRLAIPLVASGDLFDAAAGERLLRETGATTAAYARGALYNPAVFREHTALVNGLPARPLSRDDLRALILRHVELARTLEGDRRAFVKTRSILPRYAREFAGVGRLRAALCACEKWEDIPRALAAYLPF